MSLFICEKCNALENHSCCSPNNIMPTSKYPNMHLMDMQGRGDTIYVLDNDGKEVLFKTNNAVMMLCSECNTGTWHGEFKKEIISKESEDMYIARLSRYNYTTIVDHDDKAVIRNDDGSLSLRNEKTKTLIDWITDGYNRKYNENEINLIKMSKNDIRVAWIVDIYFENPDIFNFSVIDRLFDDSDIGSGIYDFSLFAKDCSPTSSFVEMIDRYIKILSAREKVYKNIEDEYIDFERYLIVENEIRKDNGLSFEANLVNAINKLASVAGINLSNDASSYTDDLKKLMLDFSNKNYKHKRMVPHWKDTQSEEDKNLKLKKAEEKRLRKQQRKINA